VAGAAEAIRGHGAQVLVMDDGFQHRRLARDLDIVTIDATRPFGYGRLLPAGLLREPVAGLNRAHAVVLTRCDHVPQETLRQIEEAIRRANGKLVIARSVHRAVRIETDQGEEIDLKAIKDKKVFAFCGLGNPQAFFQTLESLGAVLVESKVFDDHYEYTRQDLSAIRQEAGERQAGLILTTHKDWTKITRLAVSEEQPSLAYLAVELQITAGTDALTDLIDRVLKGKIRPL
jgi:tetraacyldisaccharide 4'-kinase